jgi:hypothetical protein
MPREAYQQLRLTSGRPDLNRRPLDPHEGDGLQECVLAQVKAVPGRAGESLREQVRAERAPICAPIRYRQTETSAALASK